jgi:hypothetical protein
MEGDIQHLPQVCSRRKSIESEDKIVRLHCIGFLVYQ